EQRVGPPHDAVERIAIREEPLRDTLADDGDRLAAGAVVIGELSAGDERHAYPAEESRRDHPEPPARIFLAIGRREAFDAEREARPDAAGVTPRDEASHRHAFDARQLADAARHVEVLIDFLLAGEAD